jgi:hypothetical protein
MSKSRTQRIAAAILAILPCLHGCRPHKALEAATTEVARFHARYNREQYQDIHADADPGLRTRFTSTEWAERLARYRGKLGTVKGTEMAEWHHSTLGVDTLLVTTHRTRFEKATATETFTFRTASARASLLAYSIESPLLNSK